jgi:hypothetical protein
MTDQRFPTTEPPPTDEHDIPCLNCNYNLRGLSGDPRRCPECGALNPIDTLAVPKDLVDAQVRRMETLPALCVAACLLFLCSLWLMFESQVPCCAVFTLMAPAVWLVCAVRFGIACGEKPGWERILAVYHLYGLGLAAAGVLAMSAVPRLFDRLFTPFDLRRESRVTVALVVTTVSLVLLLIATVRVHRRLAARLDPFVREQALKRAHREARRLLQARMRDEMARDRYRDAGL